jgi:hypothetical protein
VDSHTQKVFETVDRLKGEKDGILNLWREIGEFIFPGQQDFYRYFANQNAGEKRRRPIYDPTGEQSLDIFASSMSGLLANPAAKWVGLETEDQNLMDNKEVGEFLDEAQLKVLSVFNNPRTKFYDNLFSCLKMLGSFGTGMLMMDEDEESVARFRAESPKNYDYTEDFAGGVDEIFFEREFTIGALRGKVEKEEWKIPEEYLKKPDTEKTIILRHIFPNPNYKPGGLGEKYAKYLSHYYLKEKKQLVKTGFFNQKPAAIARWDRLDTGKWPDSPARVALASVKLMQQADRAMTVAMEKELRPALFVSSESKFGKLDTSAGAVNVGRGNPNDSIRELRTTGNGVSNAFVWMEAKRQQIRTAFYVDVFQTAQDINMTATEAQIRNQERLRGIAPKATKIQSDLLGPAVEKVLAILIKTRKLNPPKALIESGSNVKITYISPIAQAQRLADAQSMLQYLNDLSQMAQVEPEVLDVVDFDAAAYEMADIRGIPEKVQRSPEEIEQIREQRAQAAQAQQQLQLLQQAGEAGQAVQGAVSGAIS